MNLFGDEIENFLNGNDKCPSMLKDNLLLSKWIYEKQRSRWLYNEMFFHENNRKSNNKPRVVISFYFNTMKILRISKKKKFFSQLTNELKLA